MVDEERLKQDEAAESKTKWKTSRGFVYPAPRKAVEFIQHPMKPSDSRIDTLKLPWVENELHPQPVSRSALLGKDQIDFDTIPGYTLNITSLTPPCPFMYYYISFFFFFNNISSFSLSLYKNSTNSSRKRVIRRIEVAEI